MKKFPAICFLMVISASAPAEVSPVTANTSGVGLVRAKPDSVRVIWGVETQAKDITNARAENAQLVAACSRAIDALKITDLKVKSVSLNVEILREPYDRRDNPPAVVGYRITHILSCRAQADSAEKLADIAGKIVDAALGAGANLLQGVVFFLEDKESAQREALRKAVEDARQNAAALAKGAGMGLGELTGIQGSPSYWGYEYNYYQMNNTQTYQSAGFGGGGGEAGTALFAGELEIRCTVSASFKLVSRK
jgi:hypothetical protein